MNSLGTRLGKTLKTSWLTESDCVMSLLLHVIEQSVNHISLKGCPGYKVPNV